MIVPHVDTLRHHVARLGHHHDAAHAAALAAHDAHRTRDVGTDAAPAPVERQRPNLGVVEDVAR
jgi:hypothetical protein